MPTATVRLSSRRSQTSRTIGGTTYTFTYDYENRAQGAPAAISGGSVSVTFIYDADGNRIKSTVAGVTTVYIAGIYEFIEAGATDRVTKYYAPSGFPNALRRSGYTSDNGVFYTLRDHLNSSSVIINQTATVVSGGNQYFYPFGCLP